MSEPTARRELPPGHWRVIGLDHDSFAAVVDAEGDEVISLDGLDAVMVACDRVRNAVCALPMLVEAARGVTDMLARHQIVHYADRECVALRAALALVDGEGRADG